MNNLRTQKYAAIHKHAQILGNVSCKVADAAQGTGLERKWSGDNTRLEACINGAVADKPKESSLDITRRSS